MADENGKKKDKAPEWDHAAPTKEFDRETHVVYNIKMKAERCNYPVVWLIPKDEGEAQDRYGVPLSFIIEKGIRSGFATAPDYLNLVREKDGSLPADWHEKCQAVADTWVPGQRQPGKAAETKRKAQAADGIESQFGISVEEMAKLSPAEIAKYFADQAKGKKAKAGK